MKNIKRNAVVIVVLLFVCAAVYLNWSYNNKWGDTEALSESGESAISQEDKDYEDVILDKAEPSQDEEESSQTEAQESAVVSDYFATARLTRQQSRDEALELLQRTAETETASQDAVDSAVSAMASMADYSVQEAMIENLLIAKDFADCVVFMSADTVTVAVPSPVEGLSESAVARITDVVSSETNLNTSQLRIVEVKES